jgi:hypothetical protein
MDQIAPSSKDISSPQPRFGHQDVVADLLWIGRIGSGVHAIGPPEPEKGIERSVRGLPASMAGAMTGPRFCDTDLHLDVSRGCVAKKPGVMETAMSFYFSRFVKLLRPEEAYKPIVPVADGPFCGEAEVSP